MSAGPQHRPVTAACRGLSTTGLLRYEDDRFIRLVAQDTNLVKQLFIYRTKSVLAFDHTLDDTLCWALDHSLGGWGREDLCTVLAAAEGLQVLGLSRNRFDEEAVTPLPM
jgi:Mn-dependent DtxR family transcriptional regulator